MRHYLLFLVVALMPTVLSSSPVFSSYYGLEGIWYDDYSDTQLEIRSHRRGIKVRRNGKRWRTFNEMGHGLFDDCKGSIIVYRGRGEIQYRRKRRNSIYLSRYNKYNRRSNYTRSCEIDPYRRNQNSDYGYGNRGNNYGYRDQYCGSWYCEDQGFNITIEAYGRGGIRARHGIDDWVYYNTYRNSRYSNSRGSGYYFDDDVLIWSSRNGRRKLRFRKG